MKLRIASVQLSPIFKLVEGNIDRTNSLIASIGRDEIDILLLPELAFSGYCFASKDDIKPYVEDANGVSYNWASSTAMKLNCYVFVGFAERATDEIYYNSLLIVNPAGQIHTIYRKHFLYSTDESWATEGDGFMVVDLSFNEGKNVVRVAPAICMDLNPKKFEARFEDYELATFAVENNVDAVIAIMAWLDSSSKDSDGEEDANEPGSDWRDAQEYIGYWVHRLTPLLTKSGAPGSKDVIFIACNRVGTEGDSTFCGTSAFVQLSHTPVVLAHAKRKGEEVLRAEIEI